MKSPVIAAMLLVLTVPALASPRMTATPAQWKDIHTLQNVFAQCGGRTVIGKEEEDLNVREACALSGKLQDKLIAQGFCFYRRIEIGRTGRRYTQKEWERETGDTGPVPKDMRYCYALHEPAR